MAAFLTTFRKALQRAKAAAPTLFQSRPTRKDPWYFADPHPHDTPRGRARNPANQPLIDAIDDAQHERAFGRPRWIPRRRRWLR